MCQIHVIMPYPISYEFRINYFRHKWIYVCVCDQIQFVWEFGSLLFFRSFSRAIFPAIILLFFFISRSVKTTMSTTTATNKKTKTMKIYDGECPQPFIIWRIYTSWYIFLRKKCTRTCVFDLKHAGRMELRRKCCRTGRRWRWWRRHREWKTENEIIEIKTILNITHGATRAPNAFTYGFDTSSAEQTVSLCGH